MIAATAARVRARIKPTGCGLGATHSTSPCTIEDAKKRNRERMFLLPSHLASLRAPSEQYWRVKSRQVL
jgi:hypothetical protein